MQPLVSSRLLVLLRGLDTRGFTHIPHGVGRKSVNMAMFNGWIQVEDRSLKPRYKLTPAGAAYRENMTAVGFDDLTRCTAVRT